VSRALPLVSPRCCYTLFGVAAPFVSLAGSNVIRPRFRDRHLRQIDIDDVRPA
jgi:hypothetical protein